MTSIALGLLLAPQLVRLSNGIPVTVEKRPGTKVAIEVQVDVSSTTPKERAVLEVVAGAMFGESENMSLRAMQRLAWQIGGSVDCDLAGDVLRLQIVTDKAYLQPAASFLCEALRRPVFAQEAMQRSAEIVKRRLKLTSENPTASAVRRVAEALEIGPSGLASVTRDVAIKFHAFFVRPSATSIAVVGDVETDAISRLLGGFLGNWQEPTERKPVAPKGAANPTSPTFATVTASIPGPPPKDAEFAAWIVMVTAIARGKGSLVNAEMREKSGWSYYADADIQFSAKGSYAILAAPHLGNDGRGAGLLRAALARTDFDIERAKGYARGLFLTKKAGQRLLPLAQGQSTPAERAFSLAWWQTRAGSAAAGDDFARALEAVTPEQAAASAKKWLALAKFTTE